MWPNDDLMFRILVIVTNKYGIEAEYITTAIIKHVFTHTKYPYIVALKELTQNMCVPSVLKYSAAWMTEDPKLV